MTLCVSPFSYCCIAYEQIVSPFERLAHVGLRNRVLDGDQDRTNPFAAA